MTSENRISRLAGLVYLVSVVTGMFSLVYVPSRIDVANDPHATINNIRALESLFRFGIASEMIDQVAFLVLIWLLFRLLRPVGRNGALVMVALAVVGVPIALVNLTHRLDVLSMLTDARVGQAFAPVQLETMVKLSLDAYGNGLLIASLFWGLWLLPFGYLVFESKFLPRILGMFLVLGGLGYIIDVFGTLLMSHYASTFISNYALLPAGIGEIGTCLWLLLVGVRQATSSEAEQFAHSGA